MTRATIDTRLQHLEARRRPAARIVVCWCALPPGQHKPDCPAAGDPGPVVTIGGRPTNDVVLSVVYEETAITNPAPSVTPTPAPVASVASVASAPAAEVPPFVLAAQRRAREAYTRK